MSHLQKDRIWSGRTLPSVSRPEDVIHTLKIWERNAHHAITRPPTLKAPRNFTAISQRGGIQLSWRPDPEASGYEIIRSLNGDFSEENNPDIVTISVNGQQFSSYFDTVGGTGGSVVQKRWYRIRGISGTNEFPHGGTALSGRLVRGILSGVIWATSIDPSDTVTASTTMRDDWNPDPVAYEKKRWRAF